MTDLLIYLQIASLLEDMSGAIGDHTPPTSPLSPVTSMAAENRTELVGWLNAGGLTSCVTPLQIQGFDNLRFLGGGVLAMDDLADIGITSSEDQ